MAYLTQSGRIYLDTNIFIYALEGYPTFRAVLTTLIDALEQGDLARIIHECFCCNRRSAALARES
jgi:predicted nucleic acid-binding protein